MSLDTGKCIHAYHYEDDLPIPDSRIERVEELCRNMSGHTLMGRPAARLETMGFVDKLVCIGIFYIKGDYFPCMGAIY